MNDNSKRDRENDLYEYYIESKYYSIKQTGMHFDEAKKKNVVALTLENKCFPIRQ